MADMLSPPSPNCLVCKTRARLTMPAPACEMPRSIVWPGDHGNLTLWGSCAGREMAMGASKRQKILDFQAPSLILVPNARPKPSFPLYFSSVTGQTPWSSPARRPDHGQSFFSPTTSAAKGPPPTAWRSSGGGRRRRIGGAPKVGQFLRG